VTRDARGSPKIADAAAADAAWEASTWADRMPLSGPGGNGHGNGAASPLSITRARLDAAKAGLAELELRRREGELVEVAGVVAATTSMVSTARNRLLGIPSRLRQALPHLTAKDLAAVEAEIREALEGLAAGGERRAADGR
jgi:phage terminase Nu1 subunit (DNA packaging protein)